MLLNDGAAAVSLSLQHQHRGAYTFTACVMFGTSEFCVHVSVVVASRSAKDCFLIAFRGLDDCFSASEIASLTLLGRAGCHCALKRPSFLSLSGNIVALTKQKQPVTKWWDFFPFQ